MGVGKLTPEMVPENEEASTVDLKGSVQNPPVCFLRPQATLRTAKKDISEQEKYSPNTSCFTSNSTIPYGDLHGHGHASSSPPSLISQSTYGASGSNAALQLSALSPLLSLTTATSNPIGPSAMRWNDGHHISSYHTSGVWDLQSQLPSSAGELETCLMANGLMVPAPDAYRGISSPITGFADGSAYSPSPSSCFFSAQGIGSFIDAYQGTVVTPRGQHPGFEAWKQWSN